MKVKNTYFLLIDLAIIMLSIFFAMVLVKTDALVNILTASKALEIFGSFVAGIFFTSVFTAAPATVTLGEIAQANSVWLVALFGTIGALIGDVIIFRFVKDRFSKHLLELIKGKGGQKRLMHLLNLKYSKWLIFLIGGFIIASPLPDELGVALLGFSKIKQSWFIPFSFVANFIGILLIGILARAIL